ncbi:Mitogen-activated protein kinase 3 [Dendrobium catenatum]|uniref:Mitogen-activated protein kinase 3 n=1 Tax=Dendrobium catenatum TaxID=906689 RepID=A0A2I0WGU4_9ASPA|nr:Mitogen-activated protein kinase 3 [Dendrobium catenatum]
MRRFQPRKLLMYLKSCRCASNIEEVKRFHHLHHENVIALKDIMMPPHKTFRDIYLVYEHMDTYLHQIIKSPQALSNKHYQYFLFQLMQ